jgi:hypothetical protein
MRIVQAAARNDLIPNDNDRCPLHPKRTGLPLIAGEHRTVFLLMARDVGIDLFQIESRRTQDLADIIFRIQVLLGSNQGVMGLAVLALAGGSRRIERRGEHLSVYP